MGRQKVKIYFLREGCGACGHETPWEVSCPVKSVLQRAHSCRNGFSVRLFSWQFLLAALFLFFNSGAWAEELTLSDSVFSYTSPAGFARADGLFAVDLDELDEEFGLNTLIFAQYIPEADIPIRKNDPRAVPAWYVHLAYDGKYSSVRFGKTLFRSTSYAVGKILARQYGKPEFTSKLETLIGGALNRKVVIESMAQKGTVERKPGLRSLLAYGHGKLEGNDGEMEDFTMASLTTFYLVQGHWLTIVQASRIRSEADLPAFTQKALRIAAEIRGVGENGKK
jgi:hypothetical protein